MASTVYTAEDAAYWYVPLARAVPAAALACVITFAGGNYSPQLGLASFGGFAVVSGIVSLILTLRVFPKSVERTVFFLQAIVSVVAGAAALAGLNVGLPLFLVIVSGWAAVTGFLELYAGLRARRIRTASRDWVFIGALTAVFAIVTLVVPPDYLQHYTAPNGEPRILNASVMVVGALGVYGAIMAVYLVIAALSLKWGPAAVPRKGATS
jgi:uncharacterized membrane protein HdeD (DUF308 family)